MQCIHSDSMTDTTIRIKKDVKNELTKIALKNQSYNDVVEMLIQSYRESNNR